MDGDQALLGFTGPGSAGGEPAEPSKREVKSVTGGVIANVLPRPRLPRAFAKSTGAGVWALLCNAFRMQNTMPCVGLVVLAGCLTFVIAPNEEPPIDNRIAAMTDGALPTIVIDPGHGGRDDGARAHGLVEKELTLDLAFRVQRLLQSSGFKTALTRTDDTYLTLPDRVARANEIEHSFFVSLHFNKASNPTASGVETFYASEKVVPEAAWTWVGYFSKPEAPAGADSGETLAGYVQAALVNRTDSANRGIAGRELYVVRHTRAPAVLVEGGFISNPFDAQLIGTPEYRERLAASIADGVIEYHKTLPRRKAATQLAKASP